MEIHKSHCSIGKLGLKLHKSHCSIGKLGLKLG